MTSEQSWDLTVGPVQHRVTVRPSGLSRVITWAVDGEVVVEKKSGEDTLVLADPDGTHGSMRLLFTALGRSKRATWFEPGDAGAQVGAHLGLGGIDLDPEPGSPAALLDAKMRANPKRYAARHVLSGIAKVVLPILLTLLVARFAIRIDWPDWDLPSLPRPDFPDLVPSIPLPSISLPGWVKDVAQYAKYVLPVLIGVGLARSEIQRRKKQDQLKEELRAQGRDDLEDRTLDT